LRKDFGVSSVEENYIEVVTEIPQQAYLKIMNECFGRMGTSLASYSGSPGFKTRPLDIF
jgi:hypothetical protein